MPDNTIYKAAKFYVNELGLSVIPIRKGEKRPAIPWTEYQRRKPDSSEITSWFWDTDNQIGVVCGAVSGGLVVLDFETPAVYNAWAGRHSDIQTRTVKTGKGFHVYLRLPPDEVKGNTKLIPNQLETRGEGGQVVAPPSVHPSGRMYKLYGNIRAITNATWEQISRGEKWNGAAGGVHLSPAAAAQTIAFGVAAGERNDSIFNAAVMLRDIGSPQAQALAILYESNKHNNPPLDQAEIARTVQSAYSRPQRNKDSATVNTLPDIMRRLAALREEQAKGWLKQSANPEAPDQNFVTQCREIMKDCGALDELQIQEVLDEIMRNPPLAPRKRIELLRVWRYARKEVRDAMTGKATDDEIAAAFKAQYENKRIYTRSRWYQWEKSGVWSDNADVCDELWQMMCEFKDVDIKPSANKRHSIEECLRGRSYLGVHESKMDAHPEWLNLLNGVYDIMSNELLPHSPDQYITTQLPFEFDIEAQCPQWMKFLSAVLVSHDGTTDDDMIAFLQQAFGYSLTAWTKYELSFWMQGGGANGKSTLIHILSKMTGTASMALNLGMLERDQYQLALLPGIRVVTCTESPVGLKVADSMIKSLISGDTLSVRLPYSAPFQLQPQCKIWWAMNNYPRVADTSEGFWRKVKVIPFLASFYGEARDENLRYKLETELSGILNWSLAGLRALIRDGWVKCDAIDSATETYRKSNDVEQVFVDECCVVGNEFQVAADMLYKAYKAWCFATKHQAKSSTRVSSDWLRLGFVKKRTNRGNVYFGVGVTAQWENEAQKV